MDAEQKPAPTTTTKSSEPFGSLDKFIESAPEESAAPAPAVVEATKPAAPSSAASGEQEKASDAKDLGKEKARQLEEDFANDPLIKQAMETFQASGIS